MDEIFSISGCLSNYTHVVCRNAFRGARSTAPFTPHLRSEGSMPAIHAVSATNALTDHDEIVLSELSAVVCSMVRTFDARVLDRDGAVFSLEAWSTIAHAADAAVAMT